MSSFRKSADMLALPLPPAVALSSYQYTRTTTCRDWSAFDAPAVKRMTARRVRPAKGLNIQRQAG